MIFSFYFSTCAVTVSQDGSVTVWSHDLNGGLLATRGYRNSLSIIRSRWDFAPGGDVIRKLENISSRQKGQLDTPALYREGFFWEAAYDRYVWFIACAPRFSAFYHGRADEIKYLAISSFPHSIPPSMLYSPSSVYYAVLWTL